MNNNTQYNQQEKQLSIGKKVKYSFYSALIFFFISSPITYQLTQKINVIFLIHQIHLDVLVTLDYYYTQDYFLNYIYRDVY